MLLADRTSCAARNAHGQPRRCRRADSRRASQRSSNLARGGRQSSGPFCQAPQVPKGSAHALGGNGHLALLRSHCCRLLYCLRAALHLLRALPRLVQKAPLTSLGRPMTAAAAALGGAARLGARTQLSPAAPAPTRFAAACAPSAALRRRPVMEGGPCPLFVSASASGSPARSSSPKRFPPWYLRARRTSSSVASVRKPSCAAGAGGWGPCWTAQNRPGRSGL